MTLTHQLWGTVCGSGPLIPGGAEPLLQLLDLGLHPPHPPGGLVQLHNLLLAKEHLQLGLYCDDVVDVPLPVLHPPLAGVVEPDPVHNVFVLVCAGEQRDEAAPAVAIELELLEFPVVESSSNPM